ncbi:4'-phosphopantetheinyl transferase family protein [Paraburkholderia humisilvae]|uniref:4'-phosphopantetheinyl transferase family protein n=1 Tax=Paraburkholderia humisilvae TaxID=627669 RepID=UPI00158214E9
MSSEAGATPALLETYRTWLSDDEALQWRRFRREEDGRRYLLARGLVRGVLADRTGLRPDRLEFTVNPWGKPALRGETDASLHFNQCHTRGLMALVACHEAEVGVDVEAIDRDIDVLRVASHCSSAQERAMLEATPEDRRAERFIELWTLKEAWVKAVGRGLSLALDSFSVLIDMEWPRVVEHAADGSREAQCQRRLYAPSTAHRLALAVRDEMSRRSARARLAAEWIQSSRGVSALMKNR